MHDYVWIATRVKAQLTAKDRATLTEMRPLYASNPLFVDPHIVALIDALLAP